MFCFTCTLTLLKIKRNLYILTLCLCNVRVARPECRPKYLGVLFSSLHQAYWMSAKNVKRYDEHFKEKVTENKQKPLCEEMAAREKEYREMLHNWKGKIKLAAFFVEVPVYTKSKILRPLVCIKLQAQTYVLSQVRNCVGSFVRTMLWHNQITLRCLSKRDCVGVCVCVNTGSSVDDYSLFVLICVIKFVNSYAVISSSPLRTPA